MAIGGYRTRLVLILDDSRWVKDTDLPIPPFPGLGIRVDTYEVLNVASVTVGGSECDAECAVEEEAPARGFTSRDCLSFGFRRESEPEAAERVATKDVELGPIRAALVVVDSELGTWERSLALPFPPFAGLRIRLDFDTLLSVFTVVVGDRRGPVTCIATLVDGHRRLSEADLGALGFAESVYP